MIVNKRCANCGTKFYTLAGSGELYCQSCTGEHDSTEQELADAANVERVNKAHESRLPQSVDPRTGKASPQRRKN